MDNLDVRNLKGRLTRLVVAAATGMVVAPIIAAVLPQTSSRGWGGGAFWFGGLFMVALGMVGIALATYALLGASRRDASRPAPCRAHLPRARVVRSRPS